MQILASSRCATLRGGALRRQPVAARRSARAVAVRAALTVPDKFKTVTPVGDRVYVKLAVEEQTTSSGILLPSSAVARSNEGQVISAGKDSTLSPGDQVLFSKYAGTEVEASEEAYMLLKDDDVLGTMPTSNIADLKPTGDRVLVQALKAAQETRGGVMLGKNVEQQTIGKIIAVGPGKDEEAVSLSAGQEVLYAKYGGVELEGDNDEEFVILRESEILAVLS